MPSFRFPHHSLPPETDSLRADVRVFLAREMKHVPAEMRAQSWMGYDRAFTKKVAAQGWIGMCWPERYGGHARSQFERYVVGEEMLAAGAPVGAHWFADRQSGPLILRYGTETQREKILPLIAQGALSFCIGMSEPDAGSDLASLRARAERRGQGFVLNGTKLWTSLGMEADMMIGLFRTGTIREERHAGLSQFLIDLDLPGITIRPIESLAGAHFAEILFDNVALGEDALIGIEGRGWEQVMAELAYERAGPERILSTFPLLVALMGEIGRKPSDDEAIALGACLAELMSLRAMSISVAGVLAENKDPATEAAMVKDLGTAFEQSIPALANALRPLAPGAVPETGDYATLLAALTLAAPSFSLRGGTREILRTVIARGLGLR